MIAALFVATGGCYFGLPNVDPWDISRDARLYRGPHPVVAHPPCERWGRYWSGGPMLARTPKAKKLGDDKGCFAAALAAVRTHGGVLEHPQASHAWRTFELAPPPMSGGWCFADHMGGWTCCVEQGHYGHPARKATWLYVFGMDRASPPALVGIVGSEDARRPRLSHPRRPPALCAGSGRAADPARALGDASGFPRRPAFARRRLPKSVRPAELVLERASGMQAFAAAAHHLVSHY